MTGFTLRSRFNAGEQIFAAWLSSAIARVAGTVATTGFDACLFDIQHGEGDLDSIRDGIAAVRLAGKPSGVRMSLEGYGEGARCLDLGAEIAVMPMIDTPADAARLVQTLKYPPVGGRSWGPIRAADLLGLSFEDYRLAANEGCVVFAMVETRLALQNLDAILATPGLDGVFVGPSDLSISLSNGSQLAHRAPEVVEALRHVVARSHACGKLAAAYCSGGVTAKDNADLGVDLIAIGSDWGFLVEGANAALAAAKGKGTGSAASY